MLSEEIQTAQFQFHCTGVSAGYVCRRIVVGFRASDGRDEPETEVENAGTDATDDEDGAVPSQLVSQHADEGSCWSRYGCRDAEDDADLCW